MFDHVNGMPDHEEESAKRQRIAAIRLAGLQPIHVIHRHGGCLLHGNGSPGMEPLFG
ncbi:MAG: hypothetical protein OXI01_02210 [Albidovulum sp.]|nr:hypothetical protein [Albidovulum sp.]